MNLININSRQSCFYYSFLTFYDERHQVLVRDKAVIDFQVRDLDIFCFDEAIMDSQSSRTIFKIVWLAYHEQ